MLKFKKRWPKAQRRCFKAVAVRELIFGALRSKVTAWKVEIKEGGRQRGARVTKWQSQDPNLVSWQMEDRPTVGEKLHFWKLWAARSLLVWRQTFRHACLF